MGTPPSPSSSESPTYASSPEPLARETDTPRPVVIRVSRPYLMPDQLEMLQRQSGTFGEAGAKRRIGAFHFAWKLCRELGFPVRVLCQTMVLFQRLILWNSMKDYSTMILVSACTIIAFKVEDTPKKVRDVAAAALKIRNLSTSASNIEDLRMRIVQFEQTVLESACFDLRSSDGHVYVVKIAHALKMPRDVAALAWNIFTDAHCCEAILKQPPHTIALASIILATKLLQFSAPRIDCTRFFMERADVNEALLDILNFYALYHSESLLAGTGLDVQRMHDFKTTIAREFVGSAKSDNYHGIVMRDRKIGQEGTARYVLTSQLDHVQGETIA